MALSVDNDDGVVLRKRAVDLDFDEELGWWTANVRIEGRALGARATLYAELGDETAECKVKSPSVTTASPTCASSTPARTRSFPCLLRPADPGPDGSQTLKILVRHATVRQILGDDLSGQDSPSGSRCCPKSSATRWSGA